MTDMRFDPYWQVDNFHLQHSRLVFKQMNHDPGQFEVLDPQLKIYGARCSQCGLVLTVQKEMSWDSLKEMVEATKN